MVCYCLSDLLVIYGNIQPPNWWYNSMLHRVYTTGPGSGTMAVLCQRMMGGDHFWLFPTLGWLELC